MVVLFVIAFFLISPGALVFCTIADLVSYQFDAGQAWIFSSLMSVAIFSCFYVKYGSSKEGGIKSLRVEFPTACGESLLNSSINRYPAACGGELHYLILCATISGIYLVFNFGFHANFPKRHIGYLLPNIKSASNLPYPAEVSDKSAK